MGKKGAKIIGQFNLNQGDTLNIIVGQSGEESDGGVKVEEVVVEQLFI